MPLKYCLVAFACFLFYAECRKTYKGYKIIEVTPSSEKQIEQLKYLQRQWNIDFLVDITRIPGKEVTILVNEDQFQLISSVFSSTKNELKVIHDDLEKGLDEMWRRLDNKKNFDLEDYNTLEDINTELDKYASNCKAGVNCEIEIFGNSYEGRPLRLFKMTKPGADRKILFFDSTIHAREWLATATNLKLLDIIHKQEDEDAVSLLNKYDFYFVIVLNPDGYLYSWETDRFWRKSRSPNAGSNCEGTDLNRNFDIRWGTDGTSTNPCSQTFGGSSKASEAETRAIQDLSVRLGQRVLAWNTIHTAAQMILFAWGFTNDGATCVIADDHDQLLRVANAYADAIGNTFGTVWQRGNSCETIYPTSGSQNNFMKAKAGIQWCYTPELRGPGFDPDNSNITPSFQEYWNGVKAMVKAIEAENTS